MRQISSNERLENNSISDSLDGRFSGRFYMESDEISMFHGILC